MVVASDAGSLGSGLLLEVCAMVVDEDAEEEEDMSTKARSWATMAELWKRDLANSKRKVRERRRERKALIRQN